jgi:Uma2 family endonuclease
MGSVTTLPTRPNDHWVSGAEQRFLIHNVPWRGYIAIGEALRDRPGIRITYDRGNLELMTTSIEHEHLKYLLARLVDILSEELEVPVLGFGSATYQRKDLDRGLEPDACYYISNLGKVQGKKRIDLDRDPPPDLALEVEVSRSMLPRMNIYAALGVPEIWRFDGKKLRVYLRDVKGNYHPQSYSPTFPSLPLKELVHFIRRGKKEDDTTIVRAFRQWVKEHLLNA